MEMLFTIGGEGSYGLFQKGHIKTIISFFGGENFLFCGQGEILAGF